MSDGVTTDGHTARSSRRVGHWTCWRRWPPPPAPLAGRAGRALGIPKSSLHAILRTLLDREWVAADPTGTRFSVGLRALEVGAAFLAGADAAALYDGDPGPSRRALRRDGALCQPRPRIRWCSWPGGTRRTSSGRSARSGGGCPRTPPQPARHLLAARTDEEVDRLLQWPLPAVTGRTVTTPEALRAELAAVRRRGWAEEWEECEPGAGGGGGGRAAAGAGGGRDRGGRTGGPAGAGGGADPAGGGAAGGSGPGADRPRPARAQSVERGSRTVDVNSCRTNRFSCVIVSTM